MKNYIVKALINFNDIEEKNEFGGDTRRTANVSVWNCTKERYEYLKSKNAVMLMGIEKVKEEPVIEEPKIEEAKEEVFKEVKPKKKIAIKKEKK